VFIDRPVDVALYAGDFDVGLIDEPAQPHCVAARSRGVEQRSEPLHPPKQRDVINLDTTLSEELFEIAVRQTESEIPPDRQHDHLRREPEPHERR
jgi:hypothetical protein